MHSKYDFDYCCEELEEFGRHVRSTINKDMPIAISDIGMIGILLHLHIWNCPFCHKSITEIYETMRDQCATRSLKETD